MVTHSPPLFCPVCTGLWSHSMPLFCQVCSKRIRDTKCARKIKGDWFHVSCARALSEGTANLGASLQARPAGKPKQHFDGLSKQQRQRVARRERPCKRTPPNTKLDRATNVAPANINDISLPAAEMSKLLRLYHSLVPLLNASGGSGPRGHHSWCCFGDSALAVARGQALLNTATTITLCLESKEANKFMGHVHAAGLNVIRKEAGLLKVWGNDGAAIATIWGHTALQHHRPYLWPFADVFLVRNGSFVSKNTAPSFQNSCL